jgi:hypothetical protein
VKGRRADRDMLIEPACRCCTARCLMKMSIGVRDDVEIENSVSFRKHVV